MPYQPLPNPLYIVVWSGGYESPQYAVTSSRSEAWQIRNDWASDAVESDTFDVLKITYDETKLDISLEQSARV